MATICLLSIKQTREANNYYTLPYKLNYNSIKIGGIYRFKGLRQYTSSIGSSNVIVNYNSIVKVTVKASKNSEHPIHIRSVNLKGDYIYGIYGWINIDDLEPISSIPYINKNISFVID